MYCKPIAVADSLQTANWLTPRRIRRQAFLLTTALWIGYAFTLVTPGMRDRFGHLKGADFLHPYVLGTLALEHRGDALYDASMQRKVGEARVPESAGDWFLPVYGPQYSLMWMPFALLPYGWAVTAWSVVSVAIYGLCCYAVWSTCPNLRAYGGTVAFVAASFPGFYAVVTFGQNSACALAALTAAYFGLRAQREVLAGFCLGLLAYKPQLGLVPACVFLMACAWPRRAVAGRHAGSAVDFSSTAGTTFPASSQVILGALISVCLQFAAAWAWYGSGPIVAYWHVLTHVSSAASILEPKLYLMHSLRAFWNLLLPWPTLAIALYLLTALATVALAVACWRSGAPLPHRYAVMLLATVLVAPHLTVYDLVILAPAFLWIADWSIGGWRGANADLRQRQTTHRIAWLLYLSGLLPFAGPLARWTHVQLSVISLAALTVTFGAGPVLSKWFVPHAAAE